MDLPSAFQPIKQHLYETLRANLQMTRRVRIFQRAIVVGMLFVTALGLFFLAQTSIPGVTVATMVLVNGALGLSYWALQRGQVRLAGMLFALTGWASTTFVMVFVHGSETSPVVGMYVVMTVLCALVMGSGSGYLFGSLSLTTIVWMIFMEHNGQAPFPFVQLNPLQKAFWYIMIYIASTVLVDSIVRVIESAMKEASDRERELTQKNQELQAIRHGLEDRVEARTVEILREKQFFEALFVNSPVAIVILDVEGRVQSANPAFERLFGYPKTEAAGQVLDELVAEPGSRQETVMNTRRTLQGEAIYMHGRRRRKDGSMVWVEIRGVPVMAGQEQAGLLAIYYDMTEQVRAQEELRASETKYRALFENVLDGVYRSTPDGRFITANPAMVRMLGFDSMAELLAVDIGRDLYTNPADREALVERQRREDVTRNVELELRRKDGEIIHVLENSFVVRGEDGEVQYFEGTLTDITERKNVEERLRFLATHDALTGLPNRASFFDELNRRIESGGPEKAIAVMFLDLDGFKEVNDQFGHARGDALLQRVAGLLQTALRDGDRVARLGGDEFAFFFDDIENPAHAARLAANVQAVLSAPMQVMGVEVTITSSIGISLYPQDGSDAEILLRRADMAMYRIKEAGKNGYMMFEIG